MTTEAPAAPPVAADPAAPAPAPAAPSAPPAAAPTPAGSFLGDGSSAAPTSPPPADPGNFFDPRFQDGGKFKEGWAEGLKAKGLERLANKAVLAKDEGTFLRSLDEALGMVGKKAIPGYPGPEADEGTVAEFRRAAGVPDEPAGYELKPSDVPPGVLFDETAAGEFAQVMHRHHIPAAAAKELAAIHIKQAAAQNNHATDTFESTINSLAEKSAEIFGKEWGEGAADRQQANKDFVKMRGFDTKDPLIRAALSHPEIVRVIDEARRALRESPLPGVPNEVFTGSGSPRQQAFAIMQADRNWKKDPAKVSKIQQLHALQAQQETRGKK
jgi:hypothetical protein